MYDRFREVASVVFVYIAEAHSTDGWQLPANVEEDVLVRQHATLDDRFTAARHGVRRLGLTMPVVVDDMDDAVSDAFAAWPERIYVADSSARIVFSGGPGPWEFDPAAATSALENLLQITALWRLEPRPRGHRSRHRSN